MGPAPDLAYLLVSATFTRNVLDNFRISVAGSLNIALIVLLRGFLDCFSSSHAMNMLSAPSLILTDFGPDTRTLLLVR